MTNAMAQEIVASHAKYGAVRQSFMKKALFYAGAIALFASNSALAVDINAGPIWNNNDAQQKCPSVCSGLRWSGQWTTMQQGVMSVCGTTAGVDIPIGAISNNDDAHLKCPPQLSKTTWGGQWRTTQPGVMSVCGCNPPQPLASNAPRPAPVQARGPSDGGSVAEQVVQAHNKYRAEIGVPPLQWSSDLANQAQEWANYLASNLVFQHSQSQDEGENLWIGTSHAFSFTQMIDTFGGEKQNFRFGVFPSVSKTGNWVDVGHYTQVVWRTTTQVGCAGSDGRDGNYRFVCRYSPPGNFLGQSPY
jgi:Cysteine-rich secretory protein family/Mannan-binding protein